MPHNHFILPRRSNFPTTTLEANKHTDRLIQLNRQCESNANQFWTRLMKEYLPTLRPQSKWHTTKDPIMKGQVVWILENNSPRGLWPLGLVTEVFIQGRTTLFEIVNSKRKLAKLSRVPTSYVPWSVMEIFE